MLNLSAYLTFNLHVCDKCKQIFFALNYFNKLSHSEISRGVKACACILSLIPAIGIAPDVPANSE